jgi:hypothetical protein
MAALPRSSQPARYFDIREFLASSATPFGTCVANDPTTGVDDAPVVQLALNQLATAFPANQERPVAGLFLPPRPFNQSYKFLSPVPMDGMVEVFGNYGAFWGRAGTQITLGPGLQSAFTVNNLSSSGNGGDGTGSVIRSLEIFPTPGTFVTVPYATFTPYALGQVLTLKCLGTLVYEVVRAGTTGNTPDSLTFFQGNAHVPDRSSVWTPLTTVWGGQHILATDPNHWDITFYPTTPAPGASAVTTAIEPAWDFTPGHTTIDSNGTHWFAFGITGVGGVSTLFLGSVIVKVRTVAGIYTQAPFTVEDVLIHPATTVGLAIYGQSDPAFGNSGDGWRAHRVRTILNGNTGVYVRGGTIAAGLGSWVRVEGSAPSGQGNVNPFNPLLPPNEDGIHDESNLGNEWEHCTALNACGYDLWGAGASSETIFVNCRSEQGRVRLDAAACWIGPSHNLVFWNNSGAPGYSSTAVSLSGKGGASNVTAVLVDGAITINVTLGDQPNLALVETSTDDASFVAEAYSAGWWYKSWASIAFAAFAVSNRQSGDEGGLLWLPRGNYTGTAQAFEFPDINAYGNTTRNGSRLVGDTVKRIDRGAFSAYLYDTVVTPNFEGTPWVPHVVYQNEIAPPSIQARPRQLLIPSTGIGSCFEALSPGNAGVVEPNWALAPLVGNSFADPNSVPPNIVLRNVGVQATTASTGLIAGVAASFHPAAVAVSVVNQATLSGTGQTIDGVLCNTVGKRVLLVAQTTGPQNGPWIVQTGNWTRPADWPSTDVIPTGTVHLVAPGGTNNFKAFGGEWMVTSVSGGGVVDTDTPTFMPRVCKGQATLNGGTPSTVAVNNLWILDAVNTAISLTDVTTQAAAIAKGVLTAGAGSGTLTITGVSTNADTFSYMATNW